MANIRKSFNFRNGVQVDNDNFIVNANGLVGIGTSIPTEFLDVYGSNSGAVKVQGLTTSTTLGIAETANFYGDLKVGSNVVIDPTTGFISATKFVGDASGLTGIFALSTTGWVAQGVGLHTFRSIGIGTTNPEYSLQIGQNPLTESGVAIESSGNIRISGVVTATTFVGDVTGTATTANNLSDAANITTGTISDARLPNIVTSDINSSGVSTISALEVVSTLNVGGSQITMSGGIITATSFSGPITGSVTGVAQSATQLETARNFSLNGPISAPATSFDGTGDVVLNTSIGNTFSANTTGIITASIFSSTFASSNFLNVGIGTFEDLRINKTSPASVVLTSNENSSISIGQSVGAGNSSAQLLYTPGTGRLDINNYDVGGVSINLHEGTGAGTTEGFNIKYDNTKQFEVTYDGKVGVNRGGTSLTRNFEVGGDMFVSNDAKVAGIMTIGSGAFQVTFGDGSSLPVSDQQNFNTLSGISTFNALNVSNDLTVGQGVTAAGTGFFGGEVGIGTTNSNGFPTGPELLKGYVEGSIWSKNGFYTAGKVVITDKADGSLYIDDRVIPSTPIDYGAVVPYVDYGNFQVTTGGAAFLTNNILMVPGVGQPTVGFGTTNGGLIPASFLPGGNKYLTKVGINTYYARSIFDVGTGSTTMNSYFIPPSLTQSEVDIVSNLWDPGVSSGLTGHAESKKVTPDGVPLGSLIFNKTTEELQVSINSNTFAPIGIPLGAIIMWSGSIASIPNGWRLCDGNNGTPDLRDRFVLGAGGSYAVDVTGGRSDAVLPLHGHSISDPGHAHSYDGQTTETIVEGTAGVEVVDSNVGVTSTTSNVTTGITTTAQVGVALTGGENLPPFWALAYIMRTNA